MPVLHRLLCFLVAVPALGALLPQHAAASVAPTYSVDEFGAAGDAVADDAAAFAKAWDFVCRYSPARTVLEVPAGKVYLVGPSSFSGPCNAPVTLSIKGTILAPPKPAAWGGRDTGKWLYFLKVNLLTLHGGGTIDGSGEQWWSRSCKRNASNPCTTAPKAVIFHQCQGVAVTDLTLTNSQQMHLMFEDCFDVRALRLVVLAPGDSPNTDGIHISRSRSVVVSQCIISTGDDCISIVTNSSQIRIRNIICGPGHGISIGSLGKGGAYDYVHDVDVLGCVIADTENGVRIKTWQGGSGYARKITFSDILMRNVSNPIIIDQYYCDSPVSCRNQTIAVKIEKISYMNIVGSSATENAISFACSDASACKDIYMQGIDLWLRSGGPAAAYCWNAAGEARGHVNPPTCLSNATQITPPSTVHSLLASS